MTSIGGTVGTPTNTSSGNTGVSAGETSIRVVSFYGKEEDWDSWKEKFLLKASMRGYENFLTGDETAPAPHSEKVVTLTTLTAADIVLADLNKKGFGDLILSIDCSTSAGKVAFAAVKGTKTKEFPGGNIRAAL
jgi:hypothetical protein